MDMMRPIKVDVPVNAPDSVTPWFTRTGGITVVWNDTTPAGAPGTHNATWGDPKNEIGYRIERAPITGGVTGSFAQIGTALANATHFTDPDGNASTYAYRVVAWNAVSAVTGGSNPAVDPAGAPIEVQAAAGTNSADLTWTAPSGGPLSGSAITGYTVDASTDDGATWSNVVTDTGSASLAAHVPGLLTRGPYVFRVAAIHDTDTAEWSIASAAVAPMIRPSAVASVAGTPGNARVALRWTAPGNGGLAITHYSVQTSTTNGTTWSTAVSTGSTATSYTALGLTNGQAYRFRVTATNAAGESDPSVATASLMPYTLPGKPTLLKATAGALSARLTWAAPPSNGSAITGYVVYARILPSTRLTVVVRTTGTSATSAVVKGLALGRPYAFAVQAINKAGAGPQSFSSNKVVPFKVPTRVTNVTAVAGTKKITLHWSPPKNGGSPLLGYQFMLSTNGGRTWVAYATKAGATARSMTLTGLTSKVRYSVKVQAFNAGGAGSASLPTKALLVT
jgi:titin